MASYKDALLKPKARVQPPVQNSPLVLEEKDHALDYEKYYGCVFEHEGFTYLCIGFSVVEDETYAICKAVVEYKNKWAFIPSTFSHEGDICVLTCGGWKMKERGVNYNIKPLERSVAMKNFPGYMD